MSIERIGGVWEVACDNCEAEESFSFLDEFADVIDQLKQYGWKIYKDEDDEWCHKCPECVAPKKTKGDDLFDFSGI